ncbi:MAG TPA: hypothetical protein VG890_04960 [Puia sp.]|nr:hypothetical protein [Puia sp.]
MKPVFSLSNLRKSASVLAAVLLLTVGSAQANATPIIEKIISPVDQAVSVTYIGATDNSLVFHMEFNNQAGQKFWLIIKNDAGDVVYQQAFKDAHFSKSIRLPKEDGEMHPVFVIKTSNEEVERRFVVNRKISEHIEVTKL